MTYSRVLRVGIIGCGEITQVVHIPTFGFLSDYYRITYLCDVSKDTLEHCKRKVIGGIPKTTFDAAELCASPEVDVVCVVSANEYHTPQVILGLQHNKYVFVEKPMALSQRDADLIIEAEKLSKGKVFVGYMRRYATAFLDAVKEIGGLDQIVYARVRDIIGPNSNFVDQSGTFPKKFVDFKLEDIKERLQRSEDMMNQGLLEECGVPVTKDSSLMWSLLGGLGSHDLSAMRETIGMPTAVLGASLGFPFWNVLFQYPGFALSYESGIDGIPRFDAHIEIYSQTKSVKVQYDSPYVKGLPTTMTIAENHEGGYKETYVRKTYEDGYTLEMKELYDVIVHGKPIKTSAIDAKSDLDIFRMIMQGGTRVQDTRKMTNETTVKIVKKLANGINGTNGA